MVIRLLQSHLRAIEQAAAQAYPEECCGLLIGRTGAGDVFVTDIRASRNVAPDRRRAFEVDPAILLQAAREARQSAEKVIGHYHSHPDGAASPSARDVAMAEGLSHVWLIVGVEGGRVTAREAYAPMAGGALLPLSLCIEE